MPAGWREGVEAVPVPENALIVLGVPLTAAVIAQIIGPWAAGYVGMSGQLEKANGRTLDSLAIVEKCEATINEARP